MCIRGCEGTFITVGIARALQLVGWDFRSSIQAAGILGSDIAMAGMTVRAFIRQRTTVAIRGPLDSRLNAISDEVISLATETPDRRFDLKWANAPLYTALDTVRSSLRR